MNAGATLGKYELLSRISAGGMGEVFLARLRGAHGFARLVAVKVIRPEAARSAEARASFFDEAQLAARLSHPGIAQVFEPPADGLALSELMQGYWTRWATTRDPNGAGAFAWPRFTATGDDALELGNAGASLNPSVRAADCDFWDSLL